FLRAMSCRLQPSKLCFSRTQGRGCLAGHSLSLLAAAHSFFASVSFRFELGNFAPGLVERALADGQLVLDALQSANRLLQALEHAPFLVAALEAFLPDFLPVADRRGLLDLAAGSEPACQSLGKLLFEGQVATRDHGAKDAGQSLLQRA